MQAGQIPAKMAGIRPLIRSVLVKMAGIRLDLTGSGNVQPKTENSDETSPNSGNNCIFRFRDFFVRTKRRKTFSRKLFFLKNDFIENILRRKPFYVETNGV